MRPTGGAEDDVRAAWSPFFDRADRDLLEASVGAAARDDAERLTFLALLHAAYEQTRQIERLYDELPGVLDGDVEAADRFRTILDQMPLGDSIADVELPGPGGIDLNALPRCKPRHMVRPATMYALRLGVETVVHGDAAKRERYVAALRHAWDRAWIDSLYAHAAGAHAGDDSADLGKELRALAGRAAGSAGRIALPDRPRGGDLRPCGMKDDLCHQLGLGTLQIGSGTPALLLPSSTLIDGLTHLSTNNACAGNTLTLHGNFPPPLTSTLDVVVGSVPATIVSWMSTEIVIIVPVTKGKRRCVAFRDRTVEAKRKQMWEKSGDTAAAAAGKADCGGPVGLWTLPYVPDSAPCLGWNEITDHKPKIVFFLANGEQNTHIDPEEEVELSWQTEYAQTVTIVKTGFGPASPPSPVPLTGSANLGAYAKGLLIPITTQYTLIAKNSCGETEAVVVTEYSEEPAISISTIEVVQVLQTPAGSVRLVAQKRTMVRVSVDSGMRSEFQRNSAGANAEFVTGRATVISTAAPSGASAGLPINPGAVAIAKPPMDFNFDTLNDTLNFELPTSALVGNVRLDLDIFVPGHGSDPIGRWRTNRTTFHDFNAQPQQVVRPILINDIWSSLSPPTMAHFTAVLPGAMSRFPFAETGLVLDPPLNFQNMHVLKFLQGWQLLLADLTTSIMVSSPAPGIVAGLVPPEPWYSPIGIAHGKAGPMPAVQISKVGEAQSFAHEMGHAFSVYHAPCGNVWSMPNPFGTPFGLEPGLSGSTDARGVNVAARSVIPTGASELMSYCPSPRWPSTFLYDSLVFDRVPVE